MKLCATKTGLGLLVVSTALLTSCVDLTPPGQEPDPNEAGATRDKAPVIEQFSAEPTTVDVGQPVTLRWTVSDPEGDALRAVVSIDAQRRDDYVIDDPRATTSQVVTYRNAGSQPARLLVSDGREEAAQVIMIDVVGPIEIRIAEPYGGRRVGGPLEINVHVRSDYELAGVSAELDGQEFPIDRVTSDWGSPWLRYQSYIPLDGIAPGSKLLTIRARDIFDNVAEALRSFVYDPSPQVVVHEPLPETVVRGEVRVRVDCTNIDAEGNPEACELEISAHGDLLDTVTAPLDKVYDLSAYDGQRVNLNIRTTDYSTDIRLYVALSDKLVETVTVDGPIKDAADTRVLWVAGPDPYDDLDKWELGRVTDTTSGIATDIPLNPDRGPISARSAYLTPVGAVFIQAAASGGKRWLMSWNAGDLIELSVTTSPGQILVPSGDFAIWSEWTGSSHVFYQRQFSTRTTRDVPGRTCNVSPDGVVALEYLGDVYLRQLDGTQVLVAADGTYPMTDGTRVVFQRGDNVILYDGVQEITLATGVTNYPLYQIRNGWVAYARPGANGQDHVWRRSPAGVETQLTFFSQSSKLEKLAPNGELTFTTLEGHRYLADAAGTLTDLGTASIAEPFWIDGTWYMAIGRSLFRVEP